MADAENEVEVDAKCTKLIIRARLDMEEEFVSGKRNKSLLWEKVLQKIKEQKPDFNLTREQTIKKFVNMHTTYRRIIRRNQWNGWNTSTWEFFDDFEEIYGTRHSIEPPVTNLISSLETQVSGEDTPDQSIYDEPQLKSKKRENRNVLLQYLKDEAVKEQKHHEEIMAIEERKLFMQQQRINNMSLSFCKPDQSVDDEPQPKKKKRDDRDEILQYLEDEAVKEQKRHEEIMAMEERKLHMEQQRINIKSQLKYVLERIIGRN